MPDLTDRQQQVLDYIKERMMLGQPASVRDICEHLGGVRVNAVVCHLKALERKGYINRSNGASRRIEVCGWSPAIELRKLHDKYDKIKSAYDKLMQEVA